MSYSVLSRNSQESFNFWNPEPDLDNLKGDSHGYTQFCVNKTEAIGAILVLLIRNQLTFKFGPGTEVDILYRVGLTI